MNEPEMPPPPTPTSVLIAIVYYDWAVGEYGQVHIAVSPMAQKAFKLFSDHELHAFATDVSLQLRKCLQLAPPT